VRLVVLLPSESVGLLLDMFQEKTLGGKHKSQDGLLHDALGCIEST
jgi:hypothetical protein